VQHHDSILTKVLIQLGTNVNLQDNEGTTALLYEMRGRHFMHTDGSKANPYREVLRILLAAGANPNLTNKKKEFALALAIPTINEIGYTNLSGPRNAQIRSIESIDALLAVGADPNVRLADGLTPLIIAAGRGLGDVVKTLLAHGADVNLKAEFGLTAYHVAVGDDVIEVLQKARGPLKRLPPP
jgi:hypothetical protein